MLACIEKNGVEDDLLSGSFSYLQPFLRYSGSEYLKNTPHPYFLGKYFPERTVQGRLDSQFLLLFFN